MDEPSMGLAPILVEQVFDTIQEINGRGVTIFLVEQNANVALAIANRAYVIQTGRVVLSDSASALLANPDLSKAYLGELETRRGALDRLVLVGILVQGLHLLGVEQT